MKSELKKLEKILGINFKNLDLLHKSLIHKSYDKKNNNEKLEFFGDRVLGLIISKKLIALYPDENEGIIDKKFASLVNKKTCAKVAKRLNLTKYLLTGDSVKSLKSFQEKILSDTCESLIGAIYTDQGLEVSENFILKNWNDFLMNSEDTPIDSKTQLQEYSLKKFKKLPTYKTFKQSGPNHNPTFKIQVQIPGSKKFIGFGKSKKLAQQNAANKLVKVLKVEKI